MITSKQIIQMSEAWFASSNTNNRQFDVYINPSSSDYLELNKNKIKSVRFIVDSSSRKVYISDADNSLHREMLNKIGGSIASDLVNMNYNNFQIGKFHLTGVAEIQGNKSVMNRSDVIEYFWRMIDWNKPDSPKTQQGYKNIGQILSMDWLWVNKYVHIEKYMNVVKSDYERLQRTINQYYKYTEKK